MTRIEQEKTTITHMVQIYCRGQHHHTHTLCDDCKELLDYAHFRLDHCKFAEKKTTCKKCPVHCYKPLMREKMRLVMRYAGPRMMMHHPIAAIKHFLREL